MQSLKGFLYDDILTYTESILSDKEVINRDLTLILTTPISKSNTTNVLPYEILSLTSKNIASVEELPNIKQLAQYIEKNKYTNSTLVDDQYVSSIFLTLYNVYNKQTFVITYHGLFAKAYNETYTIYFMKSSKVIVYIESFGTIAPADSYPPFALPNSYICNNDISCIIMNNYNAYEIPLFNANILSFIERHKLDYTIACLLKCNIVRNNSLVYDGNYKDLCHLGITTQAFRYKYVIVTFDSTDTISELPKLKQYEFYKKATYNNVTVLVMKNNKHVAK